MTEQSEDLLSVVYSSTASAPFDDDALADLLRQSRRSNIANALTGMLLYREGRFVQVLEGRAPIVRRLLATIMKDPRHSDMRVLLAENIDDRRFGEWSMGYQPVSAPREELPEGYRNTFDDLENVEDAGMVHRALRELTLWFRVRAGETA